MPLSAIQRSYLVVFQIHWHFTNGLFTNERGNVKEQKQIMSSNKKKSHLHRARIVKNISWKFHLKKEDFEEKVFLSNFDGKLLVVSFVNLFT